MKLGVVGGMGPMATSMFFERVIERTEANSDQEHIDIVILNHASMPDRTKAILSGDYDDFLTNMRDDLELLERIGVSNIAIPCNTSHFFMNQMKDMTTVPIIDMVAETAGEVLKRYGKGTRVGILATNGTIHTGTYEKACEAAGLVFIKPESEMQDKVMQIIYDIKADLLVDLMAFESIIRHMIKELHCDCVILACTELSLIKISPGVVGYCIDAMDVLIEKSILYSGKNFKGNQKP
jgi:aspartate racemase